MNINFNTKKNKYWEEKPCYHRSHNFPTMIYIPPGQSFTHTCPGCGQKQTVHSPDIRC